MRVARGPGRARAFRRHRLSHWETAAGLHNAPQARFENRATARLHQEVPFRALGSAYAARLAGMLRTSFRHQHATEESYSVCNLTGEC